VHCPILQNVFRKVHFGYKRRRLKMSNIEKKKAERDRIIKIMCEIELEIHTFNKELRKLNAEKYYLERQIKGCRK
jgi:hypothetical protein